MTLEAGGGQTDSRSRGFDRALCVIAVLALATLASYLFLCQLEIRASKQKAALIGKAEDCLPVTRLHDEPPRPLGVVGEAPKRIAVHLIAKYRVLGAKSVTWQTTRDLPPGVEFTENGFVIKAPGLYFVYTQAVFRSAGCPRHIVYLSHKLARLSASYGTNITLLRATNSVCHPLPAGGLQPADPWYNTIYQGAMFEFQEGDRIFSEVSERAVRYVDTEAEKTYFGLFAL
ncbi:tumor necrosis factor-like [Mustelus asterias]